jgi:hypothetical protein
MEVGSEMCVDALVQLSVRDWHCAEFCEGG